jgi:hypothetical protein
MHRAENFRKGRLSSYIVAICLIVIEIVGLAQQLGGGAPV